MKSSSYCPGRPAVFGSVNGPSPEHTATTLMRRKQPLSLHRAGMKVRGILPFPARATTDCLRSRGMPKDYFAPFFANEGHHNLRFCTTRRRTPTRTICSARHRIPITAS